MTEREKFMELIKEANDCINHLNTETKRMKNEHHENQLRRFDELIDDLIDLSEIIKFVGTVMIKTKAKRFYDGTFCGYYYFKFIGEEFAGKEIGVYLDDKRTFAGWLRLVKGNENHKNIKRNTDIPLDEIINTWDKKEIETELYKEAQIVLTKKMETANAEYEKAKELLNNG